MMLHPATVHFAIVLPAVAAVFSLIYLYTRTESMSKISSRLTLVAAIALAVVSYTGYQAGPEIAEYLSPDAKAILIKHRNLGFILTGSLFVVAIMKIIGCKKKIFKLEVVAILLLLAVSGVGFMQGKLGGELVYTHGKPFTNYLVIDGVKDTMQDLSEAEDDEERLEAYEDGIDTIITYSEDVNSFYGNKPLFPEEDEDDEEAK